MDNQDVDQNDIFVELHVMPPKARAKELVRSIVPYLYSFNIANVAAIEQVVERGIKDALEELLTELVSTLNTINESGEPILLDDFVADMVNANKEAGE